MTVYFAKVEGGDGAIKIGFSDRVRVRILAIASKMKRPVVLLGTIAGNETTEAQLHRRFESASLGHEWFSPVPELMALVAEASKNSAPSDSPGHAPWHWKVFAARVTGAEFDDDAKRTLLLAAITALDEGTLPEMARGCGVNLRTMMRALAWLRTHRPELIAHLRERTTSPRGHDTQSG